MQTFAHLRMLRAQDAKAKAVLEKVVTRTLEILQAQNEDQSVGAIANSLKTGSSGAAKGANKSSDTPSIEFRMQTTRFLTELRVWRPAM